MSTLKFVDLQVTESSFDVKDCEAFQDHSNVNYIFLLKTYLQFTDVYHCTACVNAI